MSLYPGGVDHWWKTITCEQFQAIARRCDELGYDAIVIPEHIIMSTSHAPQMGARWVHSLSAAGFVLGATTRISVICLVVVPLHNPIELAKALSTLDYMSGGRVIPMCMVGEQDWEYAVLRSPPFSERGRVMDECMDAMIELWTADRPRYSGAYVSFDEVVFDPKPVQDPLPLWFGGRTKAAMRRIGRIGDGWMNTQIPRALIPSWIEYVEQRPGFVGRARPLEVSALLWEGVRDPYTHEVLERPTVIAEKDPVLEQIDELARLGVTMTGADMVLGSGLYASDEPGSPKPVGSFAEYLERLEWFAETILPDARAIETARLAGGAGRH
jgi:hypothetical protein